MFVFSNEIPLWTDGNCHGAQYGCWRHHAVDWHWTLLLQATLCEKKMFSAWLHKFNQLPGSIPNVCETFLVVAPTPTPLKNVVPRLIWITLSNETIQNHSNINRIRAQGFKHFAVQIKSQYVEPRWSYCRFSSAQAIQTILDKSPWDSLKIWHVFANRSVFDALEGRVCAKWRPPSPLVNVAPKKCTFSPLIQHWEGEGEGEIEEGRFLSKKCRCPNTFVQDCSSQFAPGLLAIHNRKQKLIPQDVTMFLSGFHKQGGERNKWQASVLNIKFNIRPIQFFLILVSLPKDA